MAKFLRQGTATTVEFGPLVDATDGYTYKATTITLNSTVSGVILFLRAGEAAATCKTGAVSLPEPGWARVSLAVSDTGALGPFLIRMGNVTSNLPIWSRYVVIPAAVYDSLILGTDELDVNVVQITGAAVSSAAIGSVANLTTGVNVTSIAAGVGVNVSSMGVGVNVLTITGGAVSDATIGSVANLATGVNVTSINGVAPTDIMFNANLVQCTGVTPSTAMVAYIWGSILATPPGQTFTARDYLKIIGAAVAGRCSGATSAPGTMVFYGPTGKVMISGGFASGNRTDVTWVT